ncbi:MAG: M57 family metalloprotease [Pyrinomonadaceae bacterium]
MTVNIIHNPSQDSISYSFTDAEVQAINDAFNSWQTGLLACANVQFSFIVGNAGSSSFITSGNYVNVSKIRIPLNPDGSGDSASTSLATGGAALHFANMKIDQRVTDITAFEKTVVHEVGHTFGLRHCVSGDFCGSAMDNADDYNDATHGFTSPTSCDIEAAKIAGNYCPPPTPTPTPRPTTQAECQAIGWSWNFTGSGYECFPSDEQSC